MDNVGGGPLPFNFSSHSVIFDLIKSCPVEAPKNFCKAEEQKTERNCHAADVSTF